MVSTLLAQLIVRSENRQARRRQELLPLAARVLNFAEEAWVNLKRHAVWTSRGGTSAGGLTASDYLIRYTEAHHALTLAMDELSLLVQEEPKRDDLLAALRLGSLLPGEKHDEQRNQYQLARASFVRRMRAMLQ